MQSWQLLATRHVFSIIIVTLKTRLVECDFSINCDYQGKSILNTTLNSMEYFQYICGGGDCSDPKVL